MINRGCTPQTEPVTEMERDKTKGLVVIADNMRANVPQKSRTQENFSVYVRKRFETIEN